MLELMEKYKMDYFEYQRQPLWVIDLMQRKLDIEGKLAKMEQEQPQ